MSSGLNNTHAKCLLLNVRSALVLTCVSIDLDIAHACGHVWMSQNKMHTFVSVG